MVQLFKLEGDLIEKRRTNILPPGRPAELLPDGLIDLGYCRDELIDVSLACPHPIQ
jgi:hypothetical protein